MVVIPFEGEGAGRGPLSWGQLTAWQAVRAAGDWLPLGGARPLAEGTTLSDVIDELRFLLRRYVTLRTRLHPSSDGSPWQEVCATGELRLDVVEGEGAETVAERYRCRSLHLDREWPIRAAVVCREGVPTHLVTLVSAFAADPAGLRLMLRELAERPTAPVAGLSPLEQAAWQASPAGQRQHASALRHADAVLRAIPARRFTAPVVPRAPRYWRAEFDSLALPLALRAITDRLEVDPAVTLVAVLAAALAEATGEARVLIRPQVSNRFRSGLDGVVCAAAQPGLALVDCSGPFDEVVERARRASLAAFKYGYYDPADLLARRDKVAAERGEPIELGCHLADRRGPVPMDRPAAEAIEAGLPASRLAWSARRDRPATEAFALEVADHPALPGAVRCSLSVDTAALAPRDAERVLWNMESLAVSSAHPARSSIG